MDIINDFKNNFSIVLYIMSIHLKPSRFTPQYSLQKKDCQKSKLFVIILLSRALSLKHFIENLHVDYYH